MRADLTERQAAALRALADCDTPVAGKDLAWQMNAAGVGTTPLAAHQSASSLHCKGLAVKRCTRSRVIRYELTDAGRAFAALLAGAATGRCPNCEQQVQPGVQDGGFRRCPNCLASVRFPRTVTP